MKGGKCALSLYCNFHLFRMRTISIDLEAVLWILWTFSTAIENTEHAFMRILDLFSTINYDFRKSWILGAKYGIPGGVILGCLFDTSTLLYLCLLKPVLLANNTKYMYFGTSQSIDS